MGDTGSLCLGGLIGYIALVIRQEVVVFIMCGVFVLEIASVVLQVAYYKKTGGKRIFRCAPYHWHLHMGGWPEQRVVVRLWIVSILPIMLLALLYAALFSGLELSFRHVCTIAVGIAGWLAVLPVLKVGKPRAYDGAQPPDGMLPDLAPLTDDVDE